MNLAQQNQFVRQWWKQAQQQGTILTKPVRYRKLKESLQKDYVPLEKLFKAYKTKAKPPKKSSPRKQKPSLARLAKKNKTLTF